MQRDLNADADLENLSIDSTSVKAHPQSAGDKKGSKFRIQSVYRHQSGWNELENPRSCRVLSRVESVDKPVFHKSVI